MYRHGGLARPALRLAYRLALTLAIASVFFAVRAAAQNTPFRIDDDAAAVPRGVLRVGIGADFAYADQLRQPGGKRAPLGARLGFDPTADNVVANATVSITRIPISLEYGITRWLSIGASVPLVRRRVEASVDTNVRQAPAPPVRTRLTDLSAISGFTNANLGDVDITARVALYDGFRSKAPLRFRLAAEGGMRLGSGQSRPVNKQIDPGAGDGQNDVLASVHAEAALGARWSLAAAGSRTWQRPDRQTVVSTDSVYPSERIQRVDRDLGDLTALMIAPRYRLTRYIQLAASVSHLAKTTDRYTGGTPSEGWGLIAEPLGSYDATRAGIGIVFSTTPNGGAIGPWPVDLVFEHSQIVHSSGATIPNIRVDRMGGRLYVKLF
jgi:hypothetical protein